jgi:hypothetical protein
MIGCPEANALLASARRDPEARRRVLDDHCAGCPRCIALVREAAALRPGGRGAIGEEAGEEALAGAPAEGIDGWLVLALLVACALLGVGLRSWATG